MSLALAHTNHTSAVLFQTSLLCVLSLTFAPPGTAVFGDLYSPTSSLQDRKHRLAHSDAPTVGVVPLPLPSDFRSITADGLRCFYLERYYPSHLLSPKR